MVQRKVEEPATLDFSMLYPADGDSSILEVSCAEMGEFLQVGLSGKGDLAFTFFPSTPIVLSEGQIDQIFMVARERVSLVDPSRFE